VADDAAEVAIQAATDGPRRTRRGLLRDAALLALGAGTGIVGFGELQQAFGHSGDFKKSASATTIDGQLGIEGWGDLRMVWAVNTTRPWVALTFDDGPQANWTNLVLDTLEKYEVPATFFMVGKRVRANAAVIRGRMERHEVGNHSWSHRDLGGLEYHEARAELQKTHEAIWEVVGREPKVFRPPYGHMGGAAALAASELNYQMVLWSRKMHEAHYNTCQQVQAVIDETVPGTVWLAHDVGHKDRLISLRGLPGMITGLRSRGYEFKTVSELEADASAV